MTVKYEIGEYREINKGALLASFSIIEYPSGRITRECKLFNSKDGRKFWSFPSKEYIKKDGGKGYSEYVKYLDKAIAEIIKAEILVLLEQQPQTTEDIDESEFPW